MVILSGSRGCSPRHHLDYVQRKRSKQHHQHRIGNHQHDMGEQLSTVFRGATEVVERSRSKQSGGVHQSGSGSNIVYIFSNTAAIDAYWAQYRLLFSFNGGSFEDGGDPIAGFQGFLRFYSLTTSFSTAGTNFANGDVLRFKVLAKT